MLEILAILGNVIIVLSVLPQICTQIKTRTRKGLSAAMIWCWVFGNGAMLTYNIVEVKNLYNNLLFSLNIMTAAFMLYLYYFKSK